MSSLLLKSIGESFQDFSWILGFEASQPHNPE